MMTQHEVFELIRLVLVIALVVFAAALATPRGRLPLALRGLMKIMRRDAGTSGTSGTSAKVPLWKRLLAFVLVIVAFMTAIII